MSRSSTTSSGGLKRGNERTSPLFKPLSPRSPLGFLAFSRGISRDRCGCAAGTSSSLRPFDDSRDLGWSRARRCNS